MATKKPASGKTGAVKAKKAPAKATKATKATKAPKDLPPKKSPKGGAPRGVIIWE